MCRISAQKMSMRVYVIWNEKGGTGKTTTAVNFIYNLSIFGERVLAIELDPQKNLTPFFTQANENKTTVYEVLQNPKQAKRGIYRTKYKNIDIIKGSARLRDDECAPDSLQLALEQIEKKGKYDSVVIDCRTSYENLTYNALSAADMIITPVLLDGFCRDNLNAVKKTVESIRDEKPELKWVVFANKVKNRKDQREIFVDMTQRHDYPFAETCIVENTAVLKALSMKKPLLKHASKNQATKDFFELTVELKEG